MLPVDLERRGRTGSYTASWLSHRGTGCCAWRGRCRVRLDRQVRVIPTVLRDTMPRMASRRRERQDVLWSIRLPVGLAEQIESRADDLGLDRSEAMRGLLKIGLGHRPRVSTRLERVHEELEVLRQQVEALVKMTKRG